MKELAPFEVSGERVSNAWITCPSSRDNTPKGVLIPDGQTYRMEGLGKAQADEGWVRVPLASW